MVNINVYDKGPLPRVPFDPKLSSFSSFKKGTEFHSIVFIYHSQHRQRRGQVTIVSIIFSTIL